MKKYIHLLLLGCFSFLFSKAQEPVIDYGYPVRYMNLTLEQQQVKMAYMDVMPEKPNGETVLLLHGKNFNGFYWKELTGFLSAKGYRVVVPDQVGWGKSDKPGIHYSFHMLAENTRKLLDGLQVNKVQVIAHSMGGMLGTRFTLMYPERVKSLVLENPIGLEDYRTFVPYEPLDSAYKTELAATYESYRNYQKTYYPVWKEEYEPLVAAQAFILKSSHFTQAAWANALSSQMIYEQPVCYEFGKIAVPTLLVIGQEDRTIVGKNRLSKEAALMHGQYPQLGKRTQEQIPGSKLAALAGIGHIPHIQDFNTFIKTVMPFLEQQ
ncbi:alpha/beta fold hydrolase [Sediminibacterium ginsengisoli]|uniref:Pimeloyl-ACP methyl ester carboxylesterase n=1 Tax=Sediminibacterium ginsengisoli TaxID=413434 RepID=A0A1T4NCP9_9BACT|nr:alpha/beta hydrolase [Sediminibacterium ginsengisoli]SJZ77014.1 Pimeloyl-ACP methyl ester carboxylesterase [Sediminibacterium ginsengisoli]